MDAIEASDTLEKFPESIMTSMIHPSEIKPVVIVPLYKTFLSEDEQTSLQHLDNHLNKYDIILCIPESLDIEQNKRFTNYQVARFPDYYFKSTGSYSTLLMSNRFYETFIKWSHALIYQLDCLVFSDELMEWCCKGYDYIGAPWINKYFLDDPSEGLWRVGNGGLSLRKIESHLKILQTQVFSGSLYADGGAKPWNAISQEDEIGLYKSLLPSSDSSEVDEKFITTIENECKSYAFNEDAFWSLEAPKIDSDFKVPDCFEALAFAFEMSPEWCYEKNNRKIPFGCHAWNKYNKRFWDAVINNIPYDHSNNHADETKDHSIDFQDGLIIKIRSQESTLDEQNKYINELEIICTERLNVINSLKIICDERLDEINSLKKKINELYSFIDRFNKSPLVSAIKQKLNMLYICKRHDVPR